MTLDEALAEIDRIGSEVAKRINIYGSRASRQRMVGLQAIEQHPNVSDLVLALQHLDRLGQITLWTATTVIWQVPPTTQVHPNEMPYVKVHKHSQPSPETVFNIRAFEDQVIKDIIDDTGKP